jgi:glucosamine--fructose-6-phosphate aminotransferase (isomerizing)
MPEFAPGSTDAGAKRRKLHPPDAEQVDAVLRVQRDHERHKKGRGRGLVEHSKSFRIAMHTLPMTRWRTIEIIDNACGFAAAPKGRESMIAPTTDSYMYQTMHRQPDDLRRLLDEGWEPAEQAAKLIAESERVIITGIGTSYHAALVGAWLLRAADFDARAVSSFDLALYPDSFPLTPADAVIVMAHSGVKRFSSDAMARAHGAGATVLSVGSLTAEHPGSQLVLRTVERERSAAFTSSHLAAMTVLAQVATVAGDARNASGVSGFRQALAALPDQIADVLARQDDVRPIAQLASKGRVYAAGAGPNEATALELVIKAREAAHGWVDGLALEQFLHGPLVTVNKDDLAVIIDVPGRAVERTAQVSQVLSGIGARLWLVGQQPNILAGASCFPLPAIPEVLSPLLAVVPMQILAYQMAVEKGVNPDTFRRDDPVYQAALSQIKL